MSKLMAVMASLLAIIIGLNGFFYWQQGQDLDDAMSRVEALSGQVTSLESVASSFGGEIAAISGSISSMQRDILVLESGVANLGMVSEAPVNVVPLVAPSVVRIEVATPADRTPGTGIIITQSGYVLTNEHVIEGNTSVTVTLVSGVSYLASVISENAEIDLAILKLNSERNDFPRAIFAKYEDITVGQKILALGYPYSDDLGGELSAADGIVSSLKLTRGYEYIQTDAEISLGYGGGPLVNMQGEVIGLTTWTFPAGEGLKFAIPANRLQSYIEGAIGVIA